jgi:hypothetical protein
MLLLELHGADVAECGVHCRIDRSRNARAIMSRALSTFIEAILSPVSSTMQICVDPIVQSGIMFHGYFLPAFDSQKCGPSVSSEGSSHKLSDTR